LFSCTIADLEGFDQVIFLAGLSNDPMAGFSPALNFIYNAALPAYLAFIAKQARVRRFIYAGSCSMYGYTVNELYDENSPMVCSYPYGISKLHGEQGVLQYRDDKFSVISLRQGTVSGHSPRMRFDLVVNAMFKSAMTQGTITVNNPAIWRPILDIRDAVSAYLRAVQSDYSISGTYNVASGNYTVGQIADLVRDEIANLTGNMPPIKIKDVQDFRNYKVTWAKAGTELSFVPRFTVTDIVRELFEHWQEYGNYSDPRFYNLASFKGVQSNHGRAFTISCAS
jgi:nucleoside-diphosphate-sugar epimerase